MTGRRSTSLRQTRSPQISLELQVPSFHSSGTNAFVSSSQAPTTTTPKKSNWEVIEHFNTADKGRGSVSSSLIAVSLLCLFEEFKCFNDIQWVALFRFCLNFSFFFWPRISGRCNKIQHGWQCIESLGVNIK